MGGKGYVHIDSVVSPGLLVKEGVVPGMPACLLKAQFEIVEKSIICQVIPVCAIAGYFDDVHPRFVFVEGVEHDLAFARRFVCQFDLQRG